MPAMDADRLLREILTLRVPVREALAALGLSLVADEGSFQVEIRGASASQVPVVITRAAVVAALDRVRRAVVPIEEARLWASVLLLMDDFVVDPTESPEGEEAIVETLHWLATTAQPDEPSDYCGSGVRRVEGLGQHREDRSR